MPGRKHHWQGFSLQRQWHREVQGPCPSVAYFSPTTCNGEFGLAHTRSSQTAVNHDVGPAACTEGKTTASPGLTRKPTTPRAERRGRHDLRTNRVGTPVGSIEPRGLTVLAIRCRATG